MVTPEGAAELATEMATFHGATPTQVRAVADVAYRLVQKAIMGDNMKAIVTEFSLTEDNGPGRSIRVYLKACDAVKWEQDPEKAFLWDYNVHLWVTRRGKLYTYDDGKVTGPDVFHAGLYYFGKGPIGRCRWPHRRLETAPRWPGLHASDRPRDPRPLPYRGRLLCAS